MEFDAFADENEPISKPFAEVFKVESPSKHHYAYIRVYYDGLANLETWKFGDKHYHSGPFRMSDPEDRARWENSLEVWEWLAEWEFVELRRIGPEDSEYFATEKLTYQQGNHAR